MTLHLPEMKKILRDKDCCKMSECCRNGTVCNKTKLISNASMLVALCLMNNIDMVKTMLSHDIDVDYFEDIDSNRLSPLTAAIWRGSPALVELVLAHASDLTTKCKLNGKEYTPLELAKHLSKIKILEMVKNRVESS